MATIPTAAALAARSVHVKVYPTPRNLRERRGVLKALRAFGEVDMFRCLKHETSTQPIPDAFTSLFRTPSAAAAAIAATPVIYKPTTESHTSTSTSTSKSTSQSHSQAQAQAQGPPTTSSTFPPPPPPSATSEFTLLIHPSTYPHLANIASSPLHGPYKPVPHDRSAFAADVYPRLPRRAGRSGLADWVTDSVRGRRGGGGERGEEDGDGGGGEEGGERNGNGTSKGNSIARVKAYGGGGGDTMPWRLKDKLRESSLEKSESTLDILKSSSSSSFQENSNGDFDELNTSFVAAETELEPEPEQSLEEAGRGDEADGGELASVEGAAAGAGEEKTARELAMLWHEKSKARAAARARHFGNGSAKGVT